MCLTHGQQALQVAKRQFNKTHNLPEFTGPEAWDDITLNEWYLYLDGFLAGALFQLEIDASSLDSLIGAASDRSEIIATRKIYLSE